MSSSSRHWLTSSATVTANLAVAVPTLVTFYAPPFVSFIPQVLALFGWGVWLAHSTVHTDKTGDCHLSATAEPGLAALLLLLSGLVLAVASSALFAGLPAPIAVRDAISILAAMPVMFAGAKLTKKTESSGLHHERLLRALLSAFVLAGTANALVAVTQFLAPEWSLVPLPLGGRAGGLIRQPNLLATQLLWAVLACAALRELKSMPRWLFFSLYALLLAACAMSASRMGALASLLPAVWGLMDRSLSRSTRWALVLAPVVVALFWLLLAIGAPMLGETFGGGAQLSKADYTSSRANLWRQSLVLVINNPWLGVGWGQFNLAWTLTPMEFLARSGSHTFTHSHNLFIQWAVELGVPLAVCFIALLSFAFWRATLLARRATGEVAIYRRMALVAITVMIWHSQFEFPLWNIQYLLPTVCLWGIALGGSSSDSISSRWRLRLAPNTVGALLSLSAVVALWEYQPVSQIYFPPNDGLTEQARIVRARESLLYGHLGDRFAGTLARDGERELAPFRQIVYEMLDARLLRAWMQAEAESGHEDKARYLAARLHELNDPQTRHLFAACNTQSGAMTPACNQPPPGMTFRDFR